jgi:hypothetical protein
MSGIQKTNTIYWRLSVLGNWPFYHITKVVFERSKVMVKLSWVPYRRAYLTCQEAGVTMKNWIMRCWCSKHSNVIYYHLLEAIRRLWIYLPCHDSGVQDVKSNKQFMMHILITRIFRFSGGWIHYKTESRDVGHTKVKHHLLEAISLRWLAILPHHESDVWEDKSNGSSMKGSSQMRILCIYW